MDIETRTLAYYAHFRRLLGHGNGLELRNLVIQDFERKIVLNAFWIL